MGFSKGILVTATMDNQTEKNMEHVMENRGYTYAYTYICIHISLYKNVWVLLKG